GLDVAHTGVDDEGAGAAGLEAGGQQVAEVAVGAVGGDGGDDDVAGLDLLGHDVHHPVVTRVQQHGDRGAADLHVALDGAHVGLEQADTAHGFVHRGRAKRGERVGGDLVGALDVAVNDAQFVHVCSPVCVCLFVG